MEFSREELEDIVDAIYCGANPNIDENKEIVKVARLIVKAYIVLHIPLELSMNYFFYKEKNNEK